MMISWPVASSRSSRSVPFGLSSRAAAAPPGPPAGGAPAAGPAPPPGASGPVLVQRNPTGVFTSECEATHLVDLDLLAAREIDDRDPVLQRLPLLFQLGGFLPRRGDREGGKLRVARDGDRGAAGTRTIAGTARPTTGRSHLAHRELVFLVTSGLADDHVAVAFERTDSIGKPQSVIGQRGRADARPAQDVCQLDGPRIGHSGAKRRGMQRKGQTRREKHYRSRFLHSGPFGEAGGVEPATVDHEPGSGGPQAKLAAPVLAAHPDGIGDSSRRKLARATAITCSHHLQARGLRPTGHFSGDLPLRTVE